MFRQLASQLSRTTNAQLETTRNKGVKRVFQKSRYMMRILKPAQEPYRPKPENYVPVPVSVLGSGPLRKLVNARSAEAYELAQKVDWAKYKSDVKGVRWHPSGAWMTSFKRASPEHNFYVNCSQMFPVHRFGFDRAKELAIGLRRRLEGEWVDINNAWEVADREDALMRAAKKQARLDRLNGVEQAPAEGDNWEEEEEEVEEEEDNFQEAEQVAAKDEQPKQIGGGANKA